MEIWIENKLGYIDGYSLMEQPDMIGIKVEKEPTDFSNWMLDGEGLYRDVENAPQPVPEEPTEIELLREELELSREENKELKGQVSELTDAVLFISENMGGTN